MTKNYTETLEVARANGINSFDLEVAFITDIMLKGKIECFEEMCSKVSELYLKSEGFSVQDIVDKIYDLLEVFSEGEILRMKKSEILFD